MHVYSSCGVWGISRCLSTTPATHDDPASRSAQSRKIGPERQGSDPPQPRALQGRRRERARVEKGRGEEKGGRETAGDGDGRAVEQKGEKGSGSGGERAESSHGAGAGPGWSGWTWRWTRTCGQDAGWGCAVGWETVYASVDGTWSTPGWQGGQGRYGRAPVCAFVRACDVWARSGSGSCTPRHRPCTLVACASDGG